MLSARTVPDMEDAFSSVFYPFVLHVHTGVQQDFQTLLFRETNVAFHWCRSSAWECTCTIVYKKVRKKDICQT